MWHWQRKSVRKRYALWCKLFFISTLGHIGIILVFLCLYHEPTKAIAIMVNSSAPQRQSSVNRGVLVVDTRTGFGGKDGKKQTVKAKPVAVVKKTEKQKIKPVAVLKKSEHKKANQARATVTKPARIVKAVKEAKPAAKPKVANTKDNVIKPDNKIVKLVTPEKSKKSELSVKPVMPKPVIPKPAAQEKQQVPIKQEVPIVPVLKSKPVVSVPVIEKKEPVAIKQLPAQELVEKLMQQPESKERDVSFAFAIDKEMQGKNRDSGHMQNVQDGRSMQSIQAAERCDQLRQELTGSWQPPMGIALPKGCTVSIVVDQFGKTNSIEMIEPSGALMFDISVQSVCQIKQWPQWACNRCLNITFN